MSIQHQDLVLDLVGRGIALCGAIHFLSWLFQIVPLCGTKGIIPGGGYAEDEDNEKSGGLRGNEVWRRCGDWLLRGGCILGLGVCLGLVVDPSVYVLWVVGTALLLLLSETVSPFSLQTEPFMVEAFFIMSLSQPLINYPCSLSPLSSLLEWAGGERGKGLLPAVLPPSLLVQWFSFRFMFAAGVMKWRGSEKWRNFTAMNDHYFTQPLPTPLSYYIHHYAPPFFHKISVIYTLIVELLFPFVGLLGWGWCRVGVWGSYVLLMTGINLAGNYGHLGFITSIVTFSLIPPSLLPSPFLSLIDSIPPSPLSPFPFLFGSEVVWEGWGEGLWNEMVGWGLGGGCLVHFFLSFAPLFALWGGHLVLPEVMIWGYKQVEIYQIVNPYGMFGSLQDYRWEVILEASLDGEEWKNYPFLYKPSSPSSRPPLLFPGFWPRLDWNLWLAGVKGKSQYEAVMTIGNSDWIRPPKWYPSFLSRLIMGEPGVMSLMGNCPFSSPPRYLRTSFRAYTFAPLGGKDWWTEKFVVIPGAFCLGPKGWKAPITPGFPKKKQAAATSYQLQGFGP